MNIIKPKKLKKGDTIGLLSVSGNIRNYENIERAENYFNSKGYKTIVSETTKKHFRYHSGTDKERINALQDFFINDDIDAIVCTRGGYGALRLVNDIDYDVIKKHPKIFCGYSDITVLLLMIYKKTGLVTFHGAMANGDFGTEKISEFSEKSFFDTLTDSNMTFNANGKTINSGEADGILWGGNLATIASMIGLDFIPDKKIILFIEDVNENAYKIDRMLTQIFNIEKFAKNVAGIAVGEFSGIDKSEYVNDVLMEFAKRYNIPCCDGFAISHEYNKITVPIGIECNFSSEDKTITLKEKFLE